MGGRSAEEAAVVARFAEQYRRSQIPVLLAIERSICGCEYGGTSWTTRREAELIAELLELGPGKRLLDLGAGSGWPGLYLARTSGCSATLVDIPFDGLQVAARRTAAEGLSAHAWAVAADGAQLPFTNGSFDAIGHSDLLCCLTAKASVLREARRVIRTGGRMAFSVISVAASLSAADHRRAFAAGPPFKVVCSEIPGLLAETGWQMLRLLDLTEDYAAAVGKRLAQEEANAAALIAALGDGEFGEMIARRRRTAEALQDCLLRREFFLVRTGH